MQAISVCYPSLERDARQWLAVPAMTNPAGTIAERIRQVRGDRSQMEFATELGVHKEMLGKYERGLSVPGGEVLARMREHGVDINWLLTGQGSMRENHATQKSNLDGVQNITLDEELNARVVDGISRLYKDEGVGLSSMDLGRMAAKVYSDLVNTFGDSDERRIGLKATLAQLRRQLREPPTNASITNDIKHSA